MAEGTYKFKSRYKDLVIVKTPSTVFRLPKHSFFILGRNIVFKDGIYETYELWKYKKYQADPIYSEWIEAEEPIPGEVEEKQGVDEIDGYPGITSDEDGRYIGSGELYSGPISGAPIILYRITGHSELRTEYTEFSIVDTEGTYSVMPNIMYKEREIVGHSQGVYIKDIETEYGRYPDNGYLDGYWWESIESAGKGDAPFLRSRPSFGRWFEEVTGG